jgi:hypothetical protein
MRGRISPGFPCNLNELIARDPAIPCLVHKLEEMPCIRRWNHYTTHFGRPILEVKAWFSFGKDVKNIS